MNILTLIVFLTASLAFGQRSTLLWQKTMGGDGDDVISAMTTDSEDNIFVVGTTQGAIFHDMFIARMDQNGNTIWKKEFSGNKDDQAVSVIIDHNDQIVVLASSSSTEGFPSNNHGKTDFVVMRFDKQGNLLDADNYGGTQNDIPSSIIQLPNGNYLVSGASRSSDINVNANQGQYDIWAFEINYFGSIIWGQTYGGSDEDIAVQAIALSDGNYLLSGHSTSYDAFPDNRGDLDAVLIKIDAIGNTLWQRSYGGEYSEEIAEIIELPSGNIVIASSTFSSSNDVSENNGGSDIWLFEINAVGQIVWEQSYGSFGNETAASLISTNDGFLLLGTTSSDFLQDASNHGAQDFWLYEIDNSKNIVNQQLFGASGFDSGKALMLQKDGSILLGGSTNSFDGVVQSNNGKKDGWIFKIQPNNSTSIDNITSVHPNPTSDVIYINQLEQNSAIAITNLNGQLVFEDETNSEIATLVDLSMLPSGVYIVDIISTRGKESHRLIKQ